MLRFKRLQSICLECRLPEPELLVKMWVTVVVIPGFYNACYPTTKVSIQMAIQWCEGYLKEKQNAVK